MADNSLDPLNKKTYQARADEWSNKAKISDGLRSNDNQRSYILDNHDAPIELESIDFNNKGMVLSKLKEYECSIVNSSVENAVVVTKEGKIFQCFGGKNGVFPDKDLGNQLYKAYVTHNHPLDSDNEYSFSSLDVELFMSYDLSVLRGVDEKYVYELTRNPNEIDAPMSIFDVTGYDSRHQMVIIIAQKLGIGYRRYLRG